MLYPVADCEDIINDTQLLARNYWEEVEHQELNTSISYPGGFVKASEAPLKIKRRAPLIGEHNAEILIKELGYSNDDMCSLESIGVI